MTLPKVLTIAGSDSGGGAGIQADLKTFQELDTYGLSVITAITAQNTVGVQAVHPVSLNGLNDQLESVFTDIKVDAVKTGMLVSADYIQSISTYIRDYNVNKLVIDPVLGSTSGSELTKNEAIDELKNSLWPLATVVTPNLIEAARMLGWASINTVSEMEKAVYQLHEWGAKSILLKGGHLPGGESVDLLYDGHTLTHFPMKRIDQPHTHGTGCTLASAIAAGLAKGNSIHDAVSMAKDFVTCAIREGFSIGEGSGPLNHSAYRHRQ
ncbi:bifunctional hydroxymethylpyrimidine kinase/phosphomethylpyrimidine kinase [Alkalicoccobacillus gibsonii]|uniref:Hydroxymethylpyrimidine/phosphomethylpyrimidine kinase n=1 Tax=Alkalicoccobacillus gibsonii TaxID=79881 RepID=A0ABU9VGY0_9BACI